MVGFLSVGRIPPPSGTIQFPTLLNAYGANRNPRLVPGVDYYAGCPDDVALRDPSTLTGSPDSDGCSRSSNRIFIAAGGKLDRYDFRLGSTDWYISQTANNVLIDRCYVRSPALGASVAPLSRGAGQNGFTIRRSTIDGRQVPGSSAPDSSFGNAGIAAIQNNLGLSIDLCDFKNINQHHAQIGSGPFSCTRSLFRGIHYTPDALHEHGDFLFFNNFSYATDFIVRENLFYNEPGNGQGINAFCVSAAPRNPTAYSAGTTYSVTGAVAYGGRAWQSLQNSNIGHQPDISPSWWAEITAEIRNLDISWNTIVSTDLSPSDTAPAAFNGTISSVANGGQDRDYIDGDMSNNYFDLRTSGSAWAAFYPTASGKPGATQLVTYGARGDNINMLTGAALTTTP